ncbi:MAG TPA: hypothetical protein VLX92_31690 [Kofleriaceae bacterium]|nr:hypothetical protein [Kofleriaceae bacterium]
MRRTLLLLAAAACHHDHALVLDDAGSAADASAASDASADGGVRIDPRINDTPTSGSRLQATYDVTPDGYSQFETWYDTMLETDCGFRATDDGATRCTPTSAERVTVAYSDAACTQPYLADTAQSVTTDTPAFLDAVSDPSACPAGIAVYAGGPSIPVPAASYVMAGGTCTGTAPPKRAWASRAPITSTLVGATRSIETLAPTIGVARWSADDGAVGFASWVDLASGDDCTWVLDGTARTMCLPTPVDVSATYSDAGCTSHAAVVPDGACAPPTVGYARVGCTPDGVALDDAYTLAAPQTADAWSDVLGVCTAVGSASLAAATRADPSGFPSAGPLVGPIGMGRLQDRRVVVDGTGYDVGIFDTMRGEACAFTTTATEGIRCLPALQSGYVAFLDASCTQRALVTQPPPASSTCAAEQKSYAYFTSGDGTLQPLGPGVAMSQIYNGNGNYCYLYTIGPAEVFPFTTAAVPLTAFVAATQVTQ